MKKSAFLTNAILAWIGFIGQVIISFFNLVKEPQKGPTLFGGHNEGILGGIFRVIDTLSYFTIWSVFLVALTMTLIYKNPNSQNTKLHTLRLTSLMMISITAIFYILLLSQDDDPQSWNVYTNFLNHYLTPAVTILVFVLFGPRKWFKFKTVFLALIIPTVFLIYTFIRGAIINKYPYPFLDVASEGYPATLNQVATILIAGFIFLLVFYLFDKLLPSKK
jgi:cytochrome bd-type quinol oxidase subunit 2